jgi:hypothetical protein
MRLLNRNSEPEQALKSAQDSLTVLSGSLTRGRLLMAGLIAGGVAGLTAASAGVSSLRRRVEGAKDGS